MLHLIYFQRRRAYVRVIQHCVNSVTPLVSNGCRSPQNRMAGLIEDSVLLDADRLCSLNLPGLKRQFSSASILHSPQEWAAPKCQHQRDISYKEMYHIFLLSNHHHRLITVPEAHTKYLKPSSFLLPSMWHIKKRVNYRNHLPQTTLISFQREKYSGHKC